jgi:hemerythrin
VEALAKCLDDREYIKWNNKYCVGISIIDEQHKKLFGFLNKTLHAMEHSDDKEELKDVLEEMIKYAREHFATEEDYMMEFMYPEFQYHKEEHHNFANKTIAYYDSLVNGDYPISNELIEYLKQWLVNHIQLCDRRYIDCFKKNGLK